jgi:hypothetical protein
MKYSFSTSGRTEDGKVVGVPLAVRAKAAPARTRAAAAGAAKRVAAKASAKSPRIKG